MLISLDFKRFLHLQKFKRCIGLEVGFELTLLSTCDHRNVGRSRVKYSGANLPLHLITKGKLIVFMALHLLVMH